MKTRFIINSKTFRSILKTVSNDHEYIKLSLSETELSLQGHKLGITCKEPGSFEVDLESIKRMAKVLKHLKEQPISVEIDHDRFTLNCAVI